MGKGTHTTGDKSSCLHAHLLHSGTSSFKATTRPPLANNGGNGGTHLALKYYREGIDDVQRRCGTPHAKLLAVYSHANSTSLLRAQMNGSDSCVCLIHIYQHRHTNAHTNHRQAHLVMPFDRQTARPKELISSSSSTGNAIGPGSYIRSVFV